MCVYVCVSTFEAINNQWRDLDLVCICITMCSLMMSPFSRDCIKPKIHVDYCIVKNFSGKKVWQIPKIVLA